MIHIMLFLFAAVCLYINAKIQQTNNAMPTSVPSEEAEEAERIQEPEEITDSINAAKQINESTIQGSIYCLEDKIIVNTGEKQTELTPNAFTFVPDENIICVYEGTITFDASRYPTAGCTAGTNDRYALYQETAEKNILFVNMLFVNQETGNFYTWKGEDLVPIVEQDTEIFYTWKDGELFLIGTQEKQAQYALKNPTAESGNDLPQEHMTEDELLDKVMDALQQAGYNETNLIYDGTIHYINRTYDMVSAFDDFPDHIVRGQRYYIDRKTKALYRVEEEPEFLRTELYYIGTLQ